MNNSGIYKIYWSNCDHFYFGQAVNFINRFKEHKSYLSRGIHKNERLQRVFNKYGMPLFNIIIICDRLELNEIEQHLIDINFNNEYCCNLAISVNNKVMTDETKDKIRKCREGTLLSDSHKNNISTGLKNAYMNGRKSHMKDRKGKLNYFFGKNHSDETKLKMKAKPKRRIGGSNGRARIVLNTEIGIFYDCALDAANSIGIRPNKLYSQLSGYAKNKTSFIYV